MRGNLKTQLGIKRRKTTKTDLSISGSNEEDEPPSYHTAGTYSHPNLSYVIKGKQTKNKTYTSGNVKEKEIKKDISELEGWIIKELAPKPDDPIDPDKFKFFSKSENILDRLDANPALEKQLERWNIQNTRQVTVRMYTVKRYAA